MYEVLWASVPLGHCCCLPLEGATTSWCLEEYPGRCSWYIWLRGLFDGRSRNPSTRARTQMNNWQMNWQRPRCSSWFTFSHAEGVWIFPSVGCCLVTSDTDLTLYGNLILEGCTIGGRRRATNSTHERPILAALLSLPSHASASARAHPHMWIILVQGRAKYDLIHRTNLRYWHIDHKISLM